MTIGMAVASVYAKAQDRLAARAVEGSESILRRLVSRVRASVSDSADLTASGALVDVEQRPKSEVNIAALARVFDAHVAADAAFGQQLAALLEELSADPVVSNFVTHVSGNAEVAKIVNISQAGDVSL